MCSQRMMTCAPNFLAEERVYLALNQRQPSCPFCLTVAKLTTLSSIEFISLSQYMLSYRDLSLRPFIYVPTLGLAQAIRDYQFILPIMAKDSMRYSCQRMPRSAKTFPSTIQVPLNPTTFTQNCLLTNSTAQLQFWIRQILLLSFDLQAFYQSTDLGFMYSISFRRISPSLRSSSRLTTVPLYRPMLFIQVLYILIYLQSLSSIYQTKTGFLRSSRMIPCLQLKICAQNMMFSFYLLCTRSSTVMKDEIPYRMERSRICCALFYTPQVKAFQSNLEISLKTERQASRSCKSLWKFLTSLSNLLFLRWKFSHLSRTFFELSFFMSQSSSFQSLSTIISGTLRSYIRFSSWIQMACHTSPSIICYRFQMRLQQVMLVVTQPIDLAEKMARFRFSLFLKILIYFDSQRLIASGRMVPGTARLISLLVSKRPEDNTVLEHIEQVFGLGGKGVSQVPV